MHRVAKLWIAGALCGALTACGTLDPITMDDIDLWRYDIEAVRAMQPQGPAFHQGLRVGYLGYADVEYGNFDYADYRHFARKAVASAKGMRVLPDQVASRTIPQEHLGELTDARARLMAALDATARRKVPLPAANAQTAFDCWLERAEENTRPAAIEECRAAFYTAIEQVEAAMAEADIEAVYIVFFAFDRADITPVARQTLDQVIDDYRQSRPVRIVLAGHADRAGPESYNMALSERRARSVARVMTDAGVDPAVLDIQWFGETRNRVPTPDGVPEPQNRRVEITFE
jgi:OmpA-OmpF porin, OOP family